MSASVRNYGGWIANSSAETGGALTTVSFVGWVMAAGAALSNVGTGGGISIERLQRVSNQSQYLSYALDVRETVLPRTPAQDLARIREVIKPSVSDLAIAFGVSRQSIYNWLNGEAISGENAARLSDFAQAADMIASEGVIVNSALLKRKFLNGKTLMQVVRDGGSVRDAASQLVQIHKREMVQRERMVARFASRAKSTQSADFDLPLANDHV